MLKVAAFCFGLFVIAQAQALQEDIKEVKAGSARDKKLFSLFSIVTFKNEGCRSNNPSRNGTCYTTTECQNKGGTISGNCAAGFGVCCLFTVNSAPYTISENCTYIQNPSFPSVYSDTAAITYTINKCSSDVCQVRLDFETFVTEAPALTTEITGGVCVDSFTATSTSGYVTPNICGINTNQHIYLDMGNQPGGTATLSFTFANQASTVRQWEIKATQVPCGSYESPEGCLQYHTTLTGRITSFNFDNAARPQHLASQMQNVCIRRAKGYCCVEYSLCTDPNSFYIDSAANDNKALVDSLCTKDYLEIVGIQQTCNTGAGAVTMNARICGEAFNLKKDAVSLNLPSVCDCTAPFNVQIVTDALADPQSAARINRGVCLNYRQIPCGTS